LQNPVRQRTGKICEEVKQNSEDNRKTRKS
jgi:hypothetical protein